MKYLTGQYKHQIAGLKKEIEEYKETIKKQQAELDAALQREIGYETRYNEMLKMKITKISKLKEQILKLTSGEGKP
jgi:predicted RNase H-like nuclease (RuvC/YqgF family)